MFWFMWKRLSGSYVRFSALGETGVSRPHPGGVVDGREYNSLVLLYI
jgi:hypothetical protein